jgi:pyridoxal biosynthesis lyase PdxS
MIRTKGEAGTGNVVEAVRHVRAVMGGIRQLQSMDEDEIYVFAKEIRAPLDLVRQTKLLGRLPVVNFAAGGVSTPADAALMMQMGCDGVFVGSGIFKSADPAKRAHAIVQAVTHYNGEPFTPPAWSSTKAVPVYMLRAMHQPARGEPSLRGGSPEALRPALMFDVGWVGADPKILAEVSANLGEPMVGIDCRDKDFIAYASRSE